MLGLQLGCERVPKNTPSTYAALLLLIINFWAIHLTGVPLHFCGGLPSRWQALSEVRGRVPCLVPDGCGLLGLPRMVAMASRLRLSDLRA